MTPIEKAARAYVAANVRFHALTVLHKDVRDPFDFLANSRRRAEQSELRRDCENAFIELAELCPEELAAE